MSELKGDTAIELSRRAWSCLLALTIAAVALGCSPRNVPRGILLITLDTTRADRLGCYGYEAARTPVLDDLAAGGARFDRVQTVVPATLPTHASLFTGLYPTATGVRYNGAFVLGDDYRTVAELLGNAGWVTAGIPAAVPLLEATGLGQGFETYLDLEDDPEREQQLLRVAGEQGSEGTRTAEQITSLGLEWLRERAAGKDAPFFLWLHYFDPHTPYEPPFPFSATFREHPYDGEIAFMDREIGRLFEGMRELGLWENVDVVVVGDHGEGLYEHGEKTHGYLVFESTLRVPLIIRRTGGARPRVIPEPVSVVDLAPTILVMAGLQAPGDMHGVSLLAAVENGRDPGERSLYFETVGGSTNFGWSTLQGLRSGPFKYIRSVEPELYDLDEDPGETQNLYDRRPGLAARLEGELATALETWSQDRTGKGDRQSVELDPGQLERLETLGYLSGWGEPASGRGPHPRDLIHLAGAVRHARSEAEVSPDVALEAYRRILEEDPGNRTALIDAAECARRIGELEEAAALISALESHYPDHFEKIADLRFRLVVAYLADGRSEASEAELNRAADAGVDDPSFLVLQAVILAVSGDDAEALTTLQEAIARGYDDRDFLALHEVTAPLRELRGVDSLVEGLVEDSAPEN